MMMFVVTRVAVMEGISIAEEWEARYKCSGLDT
jgi:hypothetical protein